MIGIYCAGVFTINGFFKSNDRGADGLSSVSVVSNSLLLKWKKL